MKAVDTNILVRLITGDDVKQARRAAALIGTGVWVSNGVLIEVEWVRSFYRWQRTRIVTAIDDLLDQDTLVMKNKPGLRWAVSRYAAGGDWADMLHVLEAADRDALLTFDRDFVAKAGSDSPVRVELVT